MKPAPFDYEAPSTLDEAIAALASGDDVKVLAGGQSLIPVLAMRLAKFDRLVDLCRIDELREIGVDDEVARVGAMVSQGVAEHHEGLGVAVPLIRQALHHVGHFQIRNRGTIGGSIAHADPAAELPAVALTLDATMEVVGPGGRRLVEARDFFEGTFTTAVGDGEILAAIRFPVWGPNSGFAVEEVARRHGDFAIVGALCGIQLSGATISRAAIGLFGMGSKPLRAEAAEGALIGTDVGSVDAVSLAHLAMVHLDPPADLHGSSAYRLAVGAHIVGKVITRAIQEAHHG